MDIQKAIQILLNAVEKGQQHGAYSLQEAKTILLAVDFLTIKPKVEEKKDVQNKTAEPIQTP
jgi:hypothetical protein